MALPPPTERDWRALPDDLIGAISGKLVSTFDYVRFRSICPSWRSAAPKRPLLPWLYQQCRNHQQLYDLCSTDQISVPPLLRSYLRGPSIYGSALGWFIFMNDGTDFSLRNPFTEVNIPLPDHPDLLGTEFIQLALSSDPAGRDCQVILYCNDMYDMFHCRIEDHAWTKLPVLPDPHHLSIIFYKGNFYAVSGYKVFVCEFEPQARMTEILPAHPLFSDHHTRGHLPSMQTYLVVSSGDLLLVAITHSKRYYNATDDTDEYECEEEFEVFRVDFDGQLRLRKLENLGGRALFLCWKSMPVSVPAGEYLGCRGNCIYYIFNNFHETNKITIFNMDNDEIRYIKLKWPPIHWFTPSLRYTLRDGGAFGRGSRDIAMPTF